MSSTLGNCISCGVKPRILKLWYIPKLCYQKNLHNKEISYIHTKRWGKLFSMGWVKYQAKIENCGLWMECIVKKQEVECIMYSQAIGTPIVELSCYYNHIIKVYISMEFLLCNQSVHFNKICSFSIKFLFFFLIDIKFLSCRLCWIKLIVMQLHWKETSNLWIIITSI